MNLREWFKEHGAETFVIVVVVGCFSFLFVQMFRLNGEVCYIKGILDTLTKLPGQVQSLEGKFDTVQTDFDRRSVAVHITETPPAGAGPNSRGTIAGKVEGVQNPERYKIVVYVLTDKWYVQPLDNATYTDVANEGEWSNWTHLGSEYAALLVRPEYKPRPQCEALPPTGGDVIAIKRTGTK